TEIFPLSLHDALPISSLGLFWLCSHGLKALSRRAATPCKWRDPYFFGANWGEWERTGASIWMNGLVDYWITWIDGLVDGWMDMRSEEHTSELQSPYDL